jgi:hypothetical protein
LVEIALAKVELLTARGKWADGLFPMDAVVFELDPEVSSTVGLSIACFTWLAVASIVE